ncbi:uncharacterized protein LOC124128155 isoform X1 [Haliotis rufescens]|uniref:uncharacterized protein LOC124128155 isoform X1 n=1 Tax=Haliotis rufescens TaxID=6454 RepID=UPI00201F5E61|nr:uncharacterized protein LOC124128155 isoform X1 [Haliotis rufescens]
MASDLPKGRRTAPRADRGSVTEVKKCADCEAVGQKYSLGSSDENIFIVHTSRSVVKRKGSKCEAKSEVLDQIKRRGAALRNSRGGSILVHLDGQGENDRCLEYFDEFISKGLTALIEDGTLFVNVFKREWLSASDDYKDRTDFVLLRVGKTKSISTVDFNTKVRNDIENENATTVNIVSLLLDKDGEKCFDAKLRDLPDDIKTFHESRHVEHKALMPNLAANPKLTSDEDSLLDYLWLNLKLKDNITSFSKIIGGGSIFIGIAEKTDESTHSKVLKGVGFDIVDTGKYSLKEVTTEYFELHINKDTFLAKLTRKIYENTSILYASGRFAREIPSGLIKLKFHELPSPNRYILQVAVGYIEGIVFSDKKGPRTYFVKGSSKEEMVCERMAVKEWILRLKRHCILCKS